MWIFAYSLDVASNFGKIKQTNKKIDNKHYQKAQNELKTKLSYRLMKKTGKQICI